MNARILIAFFTLLVATAASAADEKPTVTIGSIVPLSGDMALHGTEIEKAMKLSLDQFPKDSLKHQYRLMFEDNELDGAKSVTAAKKLINEDKADVIVTLWPPTALVVLPITERTNTLHYTIAWDPAIAREHKLVLSHQAMVGEIARTSLRLLRHEGKERIALIHLEESGFNLGIDFLKQFAQSECVEIVADEPFNPSERDFGSLVSRAAKKKPDAFLVWSVAPTLDLIVRQIRAQLPGSFVTGYFDYSTEPAQIEGVPYVSEMYAAADFLKLYDEKYNEAPVSKAPNAYDIVQLLVRAYESSDSGKLTASELKSYLVKQKDIQGAVGRFSIDASGNSTYAPAIRRVEGENRVLITLPLSAAKCAK